MSPITLSTSNDANPYLMNVNNICAVCFLQLDEHVPTFPMVKILPTKEPIQAHKVLESISKFTLASDGPQYLCFECFHKTKTIYEFQQMCNKAQSYYEDYKNKLSLIKAEIEQLVVEAPAINLPEGKKRGRPSTKVVEQNFYNEEDELINQKQSTNKQNSKFYGKTYTTYTKPSSSRVQNELQTVERPFKCFLCEKSFSTKEVLNVHMVGHKDDKPVKNVIPPNFVVKPPRKSKSKFKAISNDNQGKIDLDDAPSINLTETTSSDLYNKLKHVRRKRKHFNNSQSEEVDKKLVNDDKADKDVVIIDSDEDEGGAVEEDSSPLEPAIVLIKGEPEELQLPQDTNLSVDSAIADEIPKRGRPRKSPDDACRFCGKQFPRAALIVHERIHTGERPYECHECDKAFPTKGQLQQHMLRHSNEKPFFCEICAKTFKRREGLLFHLRRHNAADKPYLCEKCNRGFDGYAPWKKHVDGGCFEFVAL